MPGIQLLVELDDKGSPKIKKVEKSLDDLGKETKQTEKKWVRSFKKMGSATKKLSDMVKRHSASMPQFVGAAGLAGAFGALTKMGVGFNAQLESTEVQFKVITGSAKKARDVMADIVEFSASTPFQLTEVATGARLLHAFGLAGVDNLRMVGDAAAAAQEPIDQVAMTFGRIASGSFGEAFMRLAEMGIATRKMLEAKGLEFDRGGSYKGSIEQAMGAVSSIVNERFGGMMEEMSSTWSGAMSTMVDNFRVFAGVLTKPLFEALKPRIKETTRIFEDWAASPAAKTFGDSMAAMVDKAVGKLLHFVRNFGNVVRYLRIGKTAVFGFFDSLWEGLKWAGRLTYDFAMVVKSAFKEAWDHVEALVSGASQALVPIGFFMTKYSGKLTEAAEKLASKNPFTQAKGMAMAIELMDGFQLALDAGLGNVQREMDKATWTETGDAWGTTIADYTMAGFLDRFRDISPAIDEIISTMTNVKAPVVEAAADEAGAGNVPVTGPYQYPEEDTFIGPIAPDTRITDARAEMLNALAELDRGHHEYMSEMWNGYWNNLIDMGTYAMSDVLAENLLNSTADWADRVAEIWSGLKESFVRMTVDMAAQWIASKMKMFIMDTIIRKKGAQDEIAASLMAAQANNQDAKYAAKSAAAKYHEAYAPYPFIGPPLAASAIVKMLAAVQGTATAVGAFRTGGLIPGGGSGVEDDRVAFVPGGEYLMPKSAVNRYGGAFMEGVRSGTLAPGGGGGELSMLFQVDGGGVGLEQDIEDDLVPILERLIDQRRFSTS